MNKVLKCGIKVKKVNIKRPIPKTHYFWDNIFNGKFRFWDRARVEGPIILFKFVNIILLPPIFSCNHQYFLAITWERRKRFSTVQIWTNEAGWAWTSWQYEYCCQFVISNMIMINLIAMLTMCILHNMFLSAQASYKLRTSKLRFK